MVPVRVHLQICALRSFHIGRLRLDPICPCPMPPCCTSASIPRVCNGRPARGKSAFTRYGFCVVCSGMPLLLTRNLRSFSSAPTVRSLGCLQLLPHPRPVHPPLQAALRWLVKSIQEPVMAWLGRLCSATVGSSGGCAASCQGEPTLSQSPSGLQLAFASASRICVGKEVWS